MTDELHIDEDLRFSASAPTEGDDDTTSLDFDTEEFRANAGTDFNDYGVRKNFSDDGDLESVDVVFEAMQAGPPDRRNGVRITNEFLRNVAGKDYRQRPLHLLDHRSKEAFAKIGDVRTMWFSEQAEKLALVVRVPNTGGPTHSEAIARYTFDPPDIRNGSVGFGKDYTAIRNDAGEPELSDGKMREFSAVNFPGGYDDGGVGQPSTAFAEKAVDAAANFDDASSESSEGDSSDDDAEDLAAEQAEFAVRESTLTF